MSGFHTRSVHEIQILTKEKGCEQKMDVTKYSVGYYSAPGEHFKWAHKDHIEKAPQWCSVDLRDGNQSLVIPMSLEEKLEFYKMLLKIGFKEIEVGFPAASETEYTFLRTLIEQNMIPQDVTVQVLTQCREHIIRKTFEACKGAPSAIIHFYNSTSVAQREQVFKKSKEEIKQIAVDGAKLVKKLAAEYEGNFRFEYSPESFTGTEPEYALEVCNAVLDVLEPSESNNVIINLPVTVEMSLPHVYASQVEYMCENLKYREHVTVSLHPHNDRGTGVADTELGLLAGADRVEGTLFGNGERTGNVDVVAAFEKLTGIKVNYTTFDSNESLYAKLKSGAANYDVIIPSDYMVAKMISEGMLMPLDYSNIPNFQNIDEEYRNGDYDPENAYTVPYTLCTTGIIYNTKLVDEAPTSWADLWDEKYAGNILMFNNSRDAYAIGAFKSGSSVNPQTTEEVDAVVDELKAQKPLVQAYVMDEIFDKMIGSEAAVGVYYSGDAITMIDDNPDLAWVFPEEGTVLSVDSMAIPATSEHEEAAEMFINFMCEPDVGKANIEYIGYTTPMHCVWDILDEDLKYSEIAYPSEDIAAKEEVFTALSDEVNSELDVKWSEMKSYDEGGSGYLFLMLLAAMLALACFNIWRKVRRKTRNMY